MKKIILFVLALRLCFAVFSGGFAESAMESTVAEMTAEELYQTGKEAFDAEDYGKAMEYYQPAADLGAPEAMFALGECFYEGKGTEKDLNRAAEWYRKALEAGYEPNEQEQEHLKAVLGDGYQQK